MSVGCNHPPNVYVGKIMRSKCGEFLELFAVSRDNNLYVVGDISKKCLDTTETNNYQMRAKDV